MENYQQKSLTLRYARFDNGYLSVKIQTVD